MDLLLRLQKWYESQCDGDWEHQYGVRIDTLDNPGWLVKIDLEGTELQDRPFVDVVEGIGLESHPEQSQWVHCSVRDKVWQGACDSTQLGRVLKIFLDSSDERT